MLTFLKTIGLLLLSGLNNTEYIKEHNIKNLSYKLEQNQFIEREYINEFYPSMNNLIVINSTNIIHNNTNFSLSAGEEGLEPSTSGFGGRRSTN